MTSTGKQQGRTGRIPVGVPALLACLLWSSAFIAIKSGYGSGIGPFLFAGVRFFLSGLVLLPVSFILEGPGALGHTFRNSAVFILLIGLLQTAVTYGAFYAGIGLVPASVGAIVIGVQPLITSAASSRIPPKEELAGRQWFLLLVAVAGLVILSIFRSRGSGSDAGAGIRELAGILLLVVALLASAASSILVSRSRRDFSPLALSAGQFLSGGLLLLLAGLFLEDNSAIRTDRVFWFSLAWLVTVSSVGISIWFWLLRVRKAPVGALSIWKFAIPVVGAFLGWLVIPGDNPDVGSVIGMVLIAGSVFGFFLQRSATKDR